MVNSPSHENKFLEDHFNYTSSKQNNLLLYSACSSFIVVKDSTNLSMGKCRVSPIEVLPTLESISLHL